MAHAFIKPEVISDTTLALLRRTIVLPRLVWSNAVADWSGKQGDKISLRIPARLDARTRALRATTAITLDELTEHTVDLNIDEMAYSAVTVSDEQLTLDIEDYARQVLVPQSDAVAYRIENKLCGVIEGAPYPVNHQLTYAETDDLYKKLLDVRNVMNKEFLPTEGRVLVVGPDFETLLLGSDRFNRFDSIGAPATSALQQATIGRIAGFEVVLSQALTDPGAAYAFHRNAFVLSLQAPKVPAGVAFGASASSNGVAMRHIRDYDSSVLSDRSVVSVFAGANYVADGGDNHDQFVRAVRLLPEGSATS